MTRMLANLLIIVGIWVGVSALITAGWILLARAAANHHDQQDDAGYLVDA